MNKHIIYYLLAVVVMGVTVWYILNNPDVKRHSVVIDPRLQSYVEEWKSDMRANGFEPNDAIASLRSIEVGELTDEEQLGLTKYYEHKIIIDYDAIVLDNLTLRAIVYHELGHYVFGLEHGSCELMSETSESTDYYSANWTRIKEEYITLIRSQEFETHYLR